MAVRIRVYPQNGGIGGYGALGAAGVGVGAYGAVPLLQNQLTNEKKTNALRLEYERALWGERMKTVQLQTAMQYAGQAGYGAAPAAYGGAYGGYPQMAPMAALNGAWGGAGLGMGGLGMGGFGMGGLGGLGMGSSFFDSMGLDGLF